MYDIILGMPWHVGVSPNINYQNSTIQVSDLILASDSGPKEAAMKTSNISVSKFRKLLKKEGNGKTM